MHRVRSRFGKSRLAVCAEAVAYCGDHGKDIAKLAIQFGLSDPDFPTTRIGTTRQGHLKENVEWIESDVDEQLLAEVGAILAPVRDKTWPRGLPENN